MVDNNCPDRPVVAATKKNIDALKGMVEEDGWYSISQIAHTIDISEGTIHQILIKEALF